MDMTIDQQVALDEALIPHARRLRIGRRNFRLLSDISSKESTLQLVGEIRRLTDVNINKLHQPWRSFIAIINKCLSGKSSGYDSIRLSQAQFLWGFYHKRNVDFAYLLWEDFVYQVEHKDTKKSNEMYYPRFTKKTKSSSDTIVTPPPTAAAGTILSTSAKGKQPATTSKAKSLTALSKVAMTEAEQVKLATKRSLQQIYISQASGSGADEGTCTIPGVPDVPAEESDEETLGNPLMKEMMMRMMKKEMMVIMMKKEMMMMMMMML
nr:hypothetical protein [Tanacetum cinerariifolium]